MTIEQVKAEAKKRFDKDLTDEEAQAWLDAHPAGELQDEKLEDVAGGLTDITRRETNLVQMGPCPRCGCNEHYARYVGGLPPHTRTCAGCELRFIRDGKNWGGRWSGYNG